MDKLKLAWKLAGNLARQRRKTGETPTFLGAKGMLALMYQDIVQFNKYEDEPTDFVMSLAANAICALSTVLPDMDTDFEVTEPQGRQPMDLEDADAMAGEEYAKEEEEDDSNDPRWTKTEAGKPLRG